MLKYLLLWLWFFLGITHLLWAQVPLEDEKRKADSLRRQLGNQLSRNQAGWLDSLVNLEKKLLIDSIKTAEAAKKKAADNKPPAFTYRITADGTASTGNVERVLIVARGEFVYTGGEVLRITLNPLFSYGEQNKRLAEQDLMVNLNWEWFYNKRLYGFMFGTNEISNLRAIKERWLGGAGFGIRLVRSANTNITITNAVIYESTDFFTNQDVFVWRNSFRLKGTHRLFKQKLTFSYLGNVLPSLSDNNLRWNASASLDLPISKVLSLRTAVENSYESVVAENRLNNDFRWTLGFVLQSPRR